MTLDDHYWLNDWVNEYEIKSVDEIERLLRSPGSISRFVELAEAVPKYTHSVRPVNSLAVTAGAGIDLSGRMNCICSKCWLKQTQSWTSILHYFDRIVVEGLSPSFFLGNMEKFPPEQHYSDFQREISRHVAILLHLKEMGIEKYLIFKDKPTTLCPNCANKVAGKSGLGSYRDEELLAQVATRLASEARINTEYRNGIWRYWVYHRFFPDYAGGSTVGAADQPPSREEIAKRVVRKYAASSIMDVLHASNLRTPLVRAIETSWLTSRDNSDREVAHLNDVILNMNLPILTDISVYDLIKLREDESESFEAFRKGLREAIRTQISQGESDSPELVARSVVEEYVKPSLADIEHRLKINKQKLARKATASVAVGSVATSAGLMLSFPLVVATGVAAVAASLTHVYKYFDDAGSIELSDMYFLWKAKSSIKN